MQYILTQEEYDALKKNEHESAPTPTPALNGDFHAMLLRADMCLNTTPHHMGSDVLELRIPLSEIPVGLREFLKRHIKGN